MFFENVSAYQTSSLENGSLPAGEPEKKTQQMTHLAFRFLRTDWTKVILRYWVAQLMCSAAAATDLSLAVVVANLLLVLLLPVSVIHIHFDIPRPC